MTISDNKPVTTNRLPAIMKSAIVQLTASVNDMAINGMSNSDNEISKIMKSLLFCIVINVLIGITMLPVFLLFLIQILFF